jgi:tetratricopeptide (TPR) repeat protein
MRIPPSTFSVLAALLLAPTLVAQQAEPKRPKLPRDADTNDARAYVAYGNLDNTPWDKTHDAYYWAWRLEPNVTDYLYMRWNALWMRQPRQWRNEYNSGAGYVVKSKEAKVIDSLWPEVLKRDPLPYLRSACYLGAASDALAFYNNPLDRAIVLFDVNCFRQAADTLALVLQKDPTLWGLRLLRARALYYTQQYRGAAAEIQIVLDTLRARDEKYIGVWYNTKELFEHMIAASLLRARDVPGARAALGRALTENLSYFPAHALLSQIAMDQGQIPTALQEAELAVGLKENDGVLRYDYGVLLYRSGKIAEAEAQFARAVELEPYWAEARRMLAVTLDQQQKGEEAVAAYEAFLARAPKRENIRIKEVQDRIAALEAPGSP